MGRLVGSGGRLVTPAPKSSKQASRVNTSLVVLGIFIVGCVAFALATIYL